VTGTILNDDPRVTLAVSPTSVSEDGTANLVYTFTRTGITTNVLTVNYTIAGTADTSDYSGATPGTGKTITFAAGSSTATLTVDPSADTAFESDETVVLTLATGTGYTVGTTTPVTGTLTNDDTQITLAVSPSSVTEDGAANLVYTFTRTGITTNPLTVNYTVGGTATLGTDYTGIAASPATKTISFAAGAAITTLIVDPTADTTIEGDETITLALAAGTGYTVGTTTPVTGTLTNDDTQITLAVSPAIVSEDGSANLGYIFTRTGPATNALTVNYTVGGTATLGTDYTGIAASPATKTVTFLANSAIATVIVDPTADTTVEANETVALTLVAGSGYTIGTPGAVTGTIFNDDLPIIALPVVTVTASDANAGETANSGAFTLIRTGPTTSALTVNLAIGGTATNGTDYGTLATTATFAAGSPTAAVTLTPVDDLVVEGGETAVLNLLAGAGYSLGTPTNATVTIADNDWNGTANGETYQGDAGNNAINGLGGNDNLFGGLGNDVINGGEGADTLTGQGGKDTLTGGSGIDRFILGALGDSLLGGFDIITDYALGEQIDAPSTIAATTLNGSSGNATGLTAAAIQAVLTNTVFTANSARAFRVTGQTGTFIALNDGVAGFNAITDSLIHLSNYTISATNTVTLV
jgi:hypothetical protein